MQDVTRHEHAPQRSHVLDARADGDALKTAERRLPTAN